MKKGTKVRIVNPNSPRKDYKIGDILKYIGGFNYELDNGTSLVNCTLWPSEYEVIEEELPRMVEVSHDFVNWQKKELIAVLPEKYRYRYICDWGDDLHEQDFVGSEYMREIQSEHKEMTIEEIQKELGYKIKVVE